MSTVMIASSNEDLCDNIKAIIDLKRDLYSIICRNTYEDILEKSGILKPQFIVIDLIENYSEGLDLVEKIRKYFGEIHIIAVTISEDKNILIDAFRRGVDGYLVKEGLFNEIYRCVYTLLQGDKYISLKIVSKVLDYYINAPEKDLEFHLILSRKEKEHITHIANGLNTKEIAHKMEISKKTVDNYRSKIMNKLDLKCTADIVKFAIREQLIKL